MRMETTQQTEEQPSPPEAEFTPSKLQVLCDSPLLARERLLSNERLHEVIQQVAMEPHNVHVNSWKENTEGGQIEKFMAQGPKPISINEQSSLVYNQSPVRRYSQLAIQKMRKKTTTTNHESTEQAHFKNIQIVAQNAPILSRQSQRSKFTDNKDLLLPEITTAEIWNEETLLL